MPIKNNSSMYSISEQDAHVFPNFQTLKIYSIIKQPMGSTSQQLYFAIPIYIIINPTFFLIAKLNHEFYSISHNFYFKALIKLNFLQINPLLLQLYNLHQNKQMENISKIIEKNSKSRLMAATCIATLAAPYILSFIKDSLIKIFDKQKLKKALHVGIQLGGTNYNVAIGKPVTNSKGELMDFQVLITKDGKTYENPETVFEQIVHFIRANQPEETGYTFIGIASFGPLCFDESSPKYGSITTTPKKLWQNIQLLKTFKERLNNDEIKIDTDVNSCAFAQFKLGNHNVKNSLVYITVGTGVGVGVVVHGKTVHGLTHPEGGHIIVDRHQQEYKGFEGVCPFHKSCLQGMVCNKSIAERLNVNFTQLHQIADQEKIWRLLGNYLAQLCLNITLTISPQVIVIGGGIMNRKILYKFIQQEFIKLLAKYVDHPLYSQGKIQSYIKPPTLGSQVGVKGAMILNYNNSK